MRTENLGKTGVIALIGILVMTTMSGVSLAGDVIKIGVAGAHSGDLASYGLPTVKAAELVVRDVNARGGVLGKKVELVVEDDACKPEVAANTATNPALTQSGDYPNFFRTIASDDAQARLEVDFALNVLKVKDIAVLHDKGDYGKGLAEFAKGFLEKDSRANLVLYEGITPGAVDYSAIVQKIKRSKAQAVIYGGYHPEASKIVAQMRKKNMKTIFISDDGVKDDTFIKVAGKYAEGVYATGPRDVSKNPLAIAANEAHRKKFGEDPGAFYLNAYAAALALLNAIEKAGSTDYDAVAHALRTEFVDTPLGKIRFNEKGDALGVGFSVYQVQGGVYVEIR